MTGGQSATPAPRDQVDVVIVGAGPTGLALACALATRAVDFVILDRAPEGGATSRAAVVHARTLEALEEIDLSKDFVSHGLVVPRFTLRDRDNDLLTVHFETLPTDYPYTLMLPQNVTEELLANRLVNSGGVVYREHAVTDLDLDGERVTVTVARRDGSTSQLHARYLVGCDGMYSVVRERMSIGFTGDRYPEYFALADVSMDWALSRDEVQLFFSPLGLVVVAPLPGDRYRIVATMDNAPEHPALADVQALLNDRGPIHHPATIHDVVWSSRFRVHHRIADAYRRGPVFLAGDAAHVHSPAGGQGMNIGIQDALLLGNMLAEVLSGAQSDNYLDRYQALRRPVALNVITMTHRLTRAATARSHLAQAVRNNVFSLAGHLRPVQRRIAMTLSELDNRSPRGARASASQGNAHARSLPPS